MRTIQQMVNVRDSVENAEARGWWPVIALALLGLAGNTTVYAGEPDSAVVFAQSRICILSEGKQRQLDVELAETQEQRARGLMMRDSLPPTSGMLFVYPELQSGRSGFWMYQTRIPLDVAFLAPDGTILRISPMSPCLAPAATDCPVFRAEQPFQAALEMNQGFFAVEGIREGDRIVRTESERCEPAAKTHNARP